MLLYGYLWVLLTGVHFSWVTQTIELRIVCLMRMIEHGTCMNECECKYDETRHCMIHLWVYTPLPPHSLNTLDGMVHDPSPLPSFQSLTHWRMRRNRWDKHEWMKNWSNSCRNWPIIRPESMQRMRKPQVGAWGLFVSPLWMMQTTWAMQSPGLYSGRSSSSHQKWHWYVGRKVVLCPEDDIWKFWGGGRECVWQHWVQESHSTALNDKNGY